MLKKSLLSAVILSSCLVNAKTQKPNVVFILADDLGISGLNCYGTYFLETPNIDRLCKQGMKFTNGLAAYPTCQPSRMAILSGQYGPRTGGYRVMDHHRGKENLIKYKMPELTGLSLDKTTFAECFKSAGYATAMYGKWHADNYNRKLHARYQGFDEAFQTYGHYSDKRNDPPIKFPEGVDSSEFFTGKAMTFMEQSHKKNKPFLLYMPYYLVHAPLETKKEYFDHFEKKLAGKKFRDRHPQRIPLVAAMTKHLDDCVGRLLNKLKELGIEDNTLVVFTSDNGAFIQDLCGEYHGQKGWVYDGGLRVPYIFKWPGKIRPESVSNERITHVDLYPTFLALAGIDKPQGHPLDGESLAPLLSGKTSVLPKRSVFCYHPKYEGFKERNKRWRWSWRNVIYNGDYKLIEWVEYDEYKLFNVANDPKEEKDLSNSNPEKLDAMKTKLRQWTKTVGAPALELNPDYSVR